MVLFTLLNDSLLLNRSYLKFKEDLIGILLTFHPP